MVSHHQPVLLKEALYYLHVTPGEWYLDATFGAGGHSLAILQAGGNLIALDWDEKNIISGRKRLATACPPGVSYHLFHANYRYLDEIVTKVKVENLAGILFDLGFSSDQLEEGRGFSFQHSDEILDLRYNPKENQPAWLLLRKISSQDLKDILEVYSQEAKAEPIAKDIVNRAKRKKLLVKDIVEIATKYKGDGGRIHPATTILQALRIMVNNELVNLKEALEKSVLILKPNGRLVVISFHSGEDRIVKKFFRQNQSLKILTPKAVRPNPDEIKRNRRSRSAKLRAAEKVSEVSR